jgi:ABC-2 type transport system ATP-binding protein
VRRRVGYLAEDQVMYPWMTAWEICRFLQPFYPTWDEKLAADYLDRFELPRQAKIGRLSQGQAVKLGLAVALAHRPALAILDDPALGLDPISRKELYRELVEHLQAEGRTVLFSSHLLGEIEAIADVIAILDHGRIVRVASPDHLRETVRQVIVPADAREDLPHADGLLDIRQRGDQLALVVDGVAPFLEQLQRVGIEHDVVSLSIDDIFEAFVIGRRQPGPVIAEVNR